DERRPRVAQLKVIAYNVESKVDDRGGKAGSVSLAHVAVVEVQTARAKDRSGKVELFPPIVDDRAPKKARRPPVHLDGNLFGDEQKPHVTDDSQPQVSLVVERHGVDLSEGIFTVEHPTIGSREQRVSDVTQPALG